jgi:hypothetical protein
LPIDTETFLFGFIYFRWTGFYRPYSVSDFSVSVTDRIKTYMSENGERVFPTVFTLIQGASKALFRATSPAVLSQVNFIYLLLVPSFARTSTV